ncbi:DUF3616 domain-containing protein (plasmid) [Rhizobium leguminosarum]|uniref:DUF3616 domain-containing protein n=1 Tax=Rhizobium leguminosarum TaxID=384 RepID=UPI001442A20D|nr:DUF3616 domain-containing protein [Rhizobium leguminosarum]MBY5835622.1 DUF3616 domain-containing protein [Rhizobium leguminosarum]NKM78259.1 DUF3616 domain-containing protein [Rhizobium leguminosarum bv. viciae]QSZ11994.1 DUF3616 domain-containing protein [Rhizobium leguminosarum]
MRIRLIHIAVLPLLLAVPGVFAASANAMDAIKQLTPHTSPPITPDEATKVSGAACSSDGKTCLLVGDEYRYALTFDVDDTKVAIRDRVFLLPKKAEDGHKYKETDAEGVSFSDGFFYIVGSHGRNKEGEKQDSRYFAYRIPVDALSGGDVGEEDKVSAAVENSVRLAALLDQSEAFKKASALAPEKDGTNLEGLAVTGDKLFIGFRGPLPDGKAVIGETSVKSVFGGGAGGLQLHPVDLGKGQAVRDLVAYDDGLLILAGPQDRNGGKAVVYRWSPDKSPLKLAELNPAGSKDRQPETLMVLSKANGLIRCLVFDDGDVPLNPRIYEVPAKQ